MTVRKCFDKHFEVLKLKEIYEQHIIFSGVTGIDNLNQRTFRSLLDDQIEIIERKVKAGSYKFTKYKLKLISKGRGKIPREVSIPVIRDRVALKALCNFLMERYNGTIEFKLPQDLVRESKVAVESGKYDCFIKLDVKNFYPSVKHDEMLKRLHSKIRNPEIIHFIADAISTPTVIKSKADDKPSDKGIPQGLSISNLLSAIYLVNIDKRFFTLTDAKYFRYVDDILILCKKTDTDNISKEVISRFKRIGLDIYDPIKAPNKSTIGNLGDTFGYLGYKFESRIVKGVNTSIVTARLGSIEKLKESLVSIFTSYKHSKFKSSEYLLWRLNMRITGCIFEQKSRGWLFFFSEINDETLLHNLDLYVLKLIKRFDITISPRKFVKTFYEIKHNKYETKYVPNFDNYNIDQMKAVLSDHFGILGLSKVSDEDIEYEFKKRIAKQARELLADVMGFGY